MDPEKAVLYREFKQLHLMYMEAASQVEKNKVLSLLGEFMSTHVPDISAIQTNLSGRIKYEYSRKKAKR